MQGDDDAEASIVLFRSGGQILDGLLLLDRNASDGNINRKTTRAKNVVVIGALSIVRKAMELLKLLEERKPAEIHSSSTRQCGPAFFWMGFLYIFIYHLLCQFRRKNCTTAVQLIYL